MGTGQHESGRQHLLDSRRVRDHRSRQRLVDFRRSRSCRHSSGGCMDRPCLHTYSILQPGERPGFGHQISNRNMDQPLQQRRQSHRRCHHLSSPRNMGNPRRGYQCPHRSSIFRPCRNRRLQHHEHHTGPRFGRRHRRQRRLRRRVRHLDQRPDRLSGHRWRRVFEPRWKLDRFPRR